eukprot:GHRQ01020271.1.p1 GENE.GHRQ01020271.1~~GHRQ01020271.1.p1  ORF type:complete len:123 (+),score=40.23 GHRQ01020271.1:434-802(+)
MNVTHSRAALNDWRSWQQQQRSRRVGLLSFAATSKDAIQARLPPNAGAASLVCCVLEQGIEFRAVNTDAQALSHHRCENRMQIGSESTRGLGCGGNPEIGKVAALESQQGLQKVSICTDLCE